MAQGAVTASAPSYTAATVNALSLTTAGLLRIDGSGVVQPVSGTVTANQGGAPWTATIQQGGNSAVVKAASTAPTVSDPALVVSVSPNTPALRVVGNVGTFDTSSAQNQTTPGAMVLTGGEFNTAPIAITSGLSSPLQLDGIGSLKIRQTQSATTNGLTASRVVAAATTNATSLKATPGNIVAIDLFNVAAYMVFVKLYNKASAPTVGTDTPVWTIPIPSSGGFSVVFNEGEYFSTGIAFAITKLQADSDTTALVAGDVTGRIKWV
jgi:hypothetical protein